MEKIYIHPLPVRIWHWVNALGFLALIATGIQIRYLDLVQLIPFRTAVVVHNYIGFVLIANFFLWLGFYLFTDKITVYLPEMNSKKYFEDSWRQIKFYGYGIFLGEENPHHPTIYHKFNPLQIMMYQIIMLLMVPHHVLLGLAAVGCQTLFNFDRAVRRCSRGGHRSCSDVHCVLRIFGHAPLPDHAGSQPVCAHQSHVDRV
jgi:Ni,Fe-hydrogenase I cytochrome b subunit